MDHAEARELLELAAIEPGGIDRLMAGDTAEAAAVAAHLAGCRACTEEFGRLRRAAVVIRGVFRSMPPPDLRERTLAFVAAVGRDRAMMQAPAVAPARTLGQQAPSSASSASLASLPVSSPRRRPPNAWLAAAAVAVLVAIGLTAAVVGGARDADIKERSAVVAALARVTAASLRIEGEPDSERVALAAIDGSGAWGTILFSPGRRELVVVTEGLAPPPAGREYRCWLETNGGRIRVGKMFFGGGFAYWVGPVEALSNLGPEARFGVSLVDATAPDAPGQPVLVGEV